jgi:sugar (pentulose or hexulose) kinase
LALEWVRERFYPELPEAAGFEKIILEAASVPPGSQGVTFLPYFTGERSPHWDASVRALITGLGLEHHRGHIARAAMEGVAYCLADVWDALNFKREEVQSVRLTGGITRTPFWAQIVADVLGIQLLITSAADASVVGAALMGQNALGIDSKREPISKTTGESVIDFDPEKYALYQEKHRLFQKLYRQLAKIRG